MVVKETCSCGASIELDYNETEAQPTLNQFRMNHVCDPRNAVTVLPPGDLCIIFDGEQMLSDDVEQVVAFWRALYPERTVSAMDSALGLVVLQS